MAVVRFSNSDDAMIVLSLVPTLLHVPMIFVKYLFGFAVFAYVLIREYRHAKLKHNMELQLGFLWLLYLRGTCFHYSGKTDRAPTFSPLFRSLYRTGDKTVPVYDIFTLFRYVLYLHLQLQNWSASLASQPVSTAERLSVFQWYRCTNGFAIATCRKLSFRVMYSSIAPWPSMLATTFSSDTAFSLGVLYRSKEIHTHPFHFARIMIARLCKTQPRIENKDL